MCWSFGVCRLREALSPRSCCKPVFPGILGVMCVFCLGKKNTLSISHRMLSIPLVIKSELCYFKDAVTSWVGFQKRYIKIPGRKRKTNCKLNRGKALHLQEKGSYSYLFLLQLFSFMTQYIKTGKSNEAVNINVMMTALLNIYKKKSVHSHRTRSDASMFLLSSSKIWDQDCSIQNFVLI